MHVAERSPGTQVSTPSSRSTLLAFWGCCWAGSTVHGAFLHGGILVVGTLVPA